MSLARRLFFCSLVWIIESTQFRWRLLLWTLFGFNPGMQYGHVVQMCDPGIPLVIAIARKAATKAMRDIVPAEYRNGVKWRVYRGDLDSEDPLGVRGYVAWKTTPQPGRWVLRLRAAPLRVAWTRRDRR